MKVCSFYQLLYYPVKSIASFIELLPGTGKLPGVLMYISTAKPLCLGLLMRETAKIVIVYGGFKKSYMGQGFAKANDEMQ